MSRRTYGSSRLLRSHSSLVDGWILSAAAIFGRKHAGGGTEYRPNARGSAARSSAIKGGSNPSADELTTASREGDNRKASRDQTRQASPDGRARNSHRVDVAAVVFSKQCPARTGRVRTEGRSLDNSPVAAHVVVGRT